MAVNSKSRKYFSYGWENYFTGCWLHQWFYKHSLQNTTGLLFYTQKWANVVHSCWTLNMDSSWKSLKSETTNSRIVHKWMKVCSIAAVENSAQFFSAKIESITNSRTFFEMTRMRKYEKSWNTLEVYSFLATLYLFSWPWFANSFMITVNLAAYRYHSYGQLTSKHLHKYTVVTFKNIQAAK